jgi:hypothetical protein
VLQFIEKIHGGRANYPRRFRDCREESAVVLFCKSSLASRPALRYKLPPMNRLPIFFAILAAMLGLTGCLQIEKIVKLKPDGSGTVEETLVMSKATLDQMQQMMASFGGDKAKAKPPELMDEAKLKEAAGKMGEGVTFVSATKISGEKGEGFKAIYAFTDINKLKVDQNPSSAMPGQGGPKPGGEKDKKEPVVFRFAKGSPAELAVTLPQPEVKPKKEQPPGMEDMAMQMMQQMFKDMKITLAVEVQGAIKDTNAEYRDGSRVTLIDLDMNKLLADPAKFKELAKANPQSLQEGKALLKGIEGIKIESAPEVKIKFQ